ncbi:alpha/beta hydrolase family protein [Maribellus sediminis]|uniref:alpha/beta hydrolase family protein n=1 Tax=Maribellus sediminis TaxID=2696285 RepID=UPI00143030FA|nr:acetylxylan esterase [Maribellus sediminis]
MPGKTVIRFGGILFISLFGLVANAQSDQLSVFNTHREESPVWLTLTSHNESLYRHISKRALSLLDQRDSLIATLTDKSDWISYGQNIKKRVFEKVGDFKKTPLNAKITSTIQKKDFYVENTILESFPGFYVTGSLFVPKDQEKPLPCVIYCSGHSETAYRDEVYQRVILNLVKKGFAVFAFDPVGQGERLQYPEKLDNASSKWGPTAEHSYAGAPYLLLGHSLTDFMIWDGVRVIDYLSSLPIIDNTRIGITGRSGGGTQTALIAAYDERIQASAPECYITSLQRLFESIGPQDAEQNPYSAIKYGFNHADLFHMRAPKPTLMVSTTNDFFSIQGARETFSEAQKSYLALNASENLTMVESLGKHESTKENRESVYAFFQKHLDNEGNSDEESIELLAPEELRVTTTGQISTTLKSNTMFEVMQNFTDSVIGGREFETPKKVVDNRQLIIRKAHELSGYEKGRRIKSVVFTGIEARKNFKIEKYFIQGNNLDYVVPFILIKPYRDYKRPLLIYLDSNGKNDFLSDESSIEKYIEKGYSILLPDLSGCGELANLNFEGDSYLEGYSYNILFGANLSGTSIAGIQSSDLNMIYDYIQQREDIDSRNITAVVNGEMCSSYLHFAIGEPKIKKTILINPLVSYENIVRTRDYNSRYIWTAVPGALQYYDLPYLESLLTPTELIIIDPVNSKGEVLDAVQMNVQYSMVKEVYKRNRATNKLELILINDKNVAHGIEKYL